MGTQRKQADDILTYWLTPAEPAHRYFTTVIRELAAQFDAPVFEPHVTVYVTKAEEENAGKILRRAVANRPPLRLLISGIGYSGKFTKTIFVQFRPNHELTALSESLRSASHSHRLYQLQPHLSLIYKTMPDQPKAGIARALVLPFDEIVFDSAKAVISPARLTSREDVEAWRVVAEQGLTE
jgi:2'-5' RNA ligase